MEIMKRKIGFGVELRDAFTNQIIESKEIKVYANGSLPWLQKEDRYYLFEENAWDTIEITVQSEVYEKKQCSILPQEYKEEKEILQIPDGMVYWTSGICMIVIVLYPNEAYVLPEGYCRRKVTGKPFEEIRIIRNREEASFLLEDYQRGNILCMSKNEGVPGSCFRISRPAGESFEDFYVIGKENEFTYIIGQELQREYPRGSKIYGLYCTRADDTGEASVIVNKNINET